LLLLLAHLAQLIGPGPSAPAPLPVASAAPTATPSPSPTAGAGACATPPLSALADRPGLGRGPAASGAVCVASPGAFVIGMGYRSQLTQSGSQSQRLVIVPAPVILAGLPARNELIVAPGLSFSRRTGGPAFGLAPENGQQDVGIGVQHLLSDRLRTQTAVELFATLPSGYPNGPSGFTATGPTYEVAHTIAASLGTIYGLSLSNGVIVAPGFAADNTIQRYVAYQPSITFSVAVTTSTTVLLEDQITTETAPHGPSGNRALAGLQQMLSPNLIVDIDYERNLLPPPGFAQHTTFEGGITIGL
jgi:hypothetical protein